MSGIVFNIQPYSLHDGPGIRTIVFLKGCPLHCGWCSNPESQKSYPEVYYDRDKCIHDKNCDFCKMVCNIKDFSVKRTNSERKGDCDDFKEICPTGALNVYGKEMTVKEVIDKVENESAFYSHGDGGLTLSGGEPFMQGEFAIELLKEAKRRRISTAVETCGYCDQEVLRQAAELLDYILFDIKLMNEARHIQHTGVSNKSILDNLEMLFAEYPNLHKHIRTPVIPTVNDNKKDIFEIKKFLDGRDNYSYELLPYHRFGERKYELLERQYENYPPKLDKSLFEDLKSL